MQCVLCDTRDETCLWQGDRCRVILADEPLYAGFCRVIWNEHVAAMTDLAVADRAHLMDVVYAVERALRMLMKPDRVNLASLGNYVPHLHWHVIPRFMDDPTFPDAIWAKSRRKGSFRPPPDQAALQQIMTDFLH